VTRQVFLGASRDYMVETSDGTTLRVVTHRKCGSAGNRGLAHLPPERCGRSTDDKKRTGGRGAKATFRRDLIRARRARARRVRRTPEGGSAGTVSITSALVEAARKEAKGSCTRPWIFR